MKKEGLDIRGLRDLSRPFPLLRKLFDHAESKGFSSDNWDEYGAGGMHRGEEHKRATELPEEFNYFIQEYPGSYFIVAYANRQTPYFADGTRERRVRLSTVKKSDETSDKIREIDLTEMDPSNGNKIEVTIREQVRNQQFAEEVDANTSNAVSPSGEAKHTYEMNAVGKKENEKAYFSRLDQATFPWKGENKPVRWLRKLESEKDTAGISQITYRDSYMVGLRQHGGSDEEAQVKTIFKGSVDAPQSIQIEIGLGGGKGTTLYDENGITIAEHTPLPAFKNQMEILKNDPAYAFLFQRPIDRAAVIAAMQTKIRMLQTDWDKPQTIYSEPASLEAVNKLTE